MASGRAGLPVRLGNVHPGQVLPGHIGPQIGNLTAAVGLERAHLQSSFCQICKCQARCTARHAERGFNLAHDATIWPILDTAAGVRGSIAVYRKSYDLLWMLSPISKN